MDNVENMENLPDLYHEDSIMAYDNNCVVNTTRGECFQDLSSYDERFFSFPEAHSFIQNFAQEDNLSYSNLPADDIDATSAVFQHFDAILREQVDTEIEVFRESMNRILTDQQFQFKQAFGLPDTTPNPNEAIHVVPQSSYDDIEECQLSSDKNESENGEVAVERPQWCYHEDYPVEESGFPTSHEVQDSVCDDEEKLVLKLLVRMLSADAAITAALRRKEYIS